MGRDSGENVTEALYIVYKFISPAATHARGAKTSGGYLTGRPAILRATDATIRAMPSFSPSRGGLQRWMSPRLPQWIRYAGPSVAPEVFDGR